MRKRAWLLAGAIVVLINGVVIGAIAVTSNDRGDLESAVRMAAEGEGADEYEGGLGPAEPDDYFLFQRSTRGELPESEDYARAVRQARQVRALDGAGARSSSRRRDAWELEGPTNIGGRLVDLVVDPRREDTAYVAAATGGVWKTTDGGVTLEKAWDDDASQSMGAIAMGADGALWAGTGELNPGGGSITFGGTGIYRSDDGGRTWRERGLFFSGTTGDIVTHPTDERIIYVAAGGDLFNPGGDRGIYRSVNRGASWKRVLAPETPFTGGADLAMDPRNPDRIYAAMWDHRREPDVRTYGGVGSGLFRSDDGGDTWKRLENVVTAGAEAGLQRSDNLGRIGVALAPNNPDRVYVITTQTFGQDGGFYVSDDGGDSFRTAALPGSQGGFGWWFGRLWVDPQNQDHVFAAGISLRESNNGGQTWGSSQGVHADQHGLQWDPQVPNRVWLGNDGGLYRSDANGATRTWTKATYEPYTQHYQVEVAETDPTRLTGGTQDNGCIRSWGSEDGGWNGYGCGDGEYTPIDWSDERIWYGCSQYGNCSRYDERSGTIVSDNIRNTGTPPPGETPALGERWNWHAPLVIDPNDPEVLYFAGNRLNRSTDRGETWELITPPGDENRDYITGFFEPGRDDPIYRNWGTITTVSVSKSDPETIYLGTDTGRLWKTEDLGETWTEFVGKGLPKRWVTRVAIDPRDEDVAYATFSGFRNGEDAAHVFKTENGGRTWRDISGNIPNAPVNDVVVRSDARSERVYVGTDVGVFVLRDDRRRGKWRSVGRGLPLVPVLDIRLHEPSDSLFAGTFGRSVWKVGL